MMIILIEVGNQGGRVDKEGISGEYCSYRCVR